MVCIICLLFSLTIYACETGQLCTYPRVAYCKYIFHFIYIDWAKWIFLFKSNFLFNFFQLFWMAYQCWFVLSKKTYFTSESILYVWTQNARGVTRIYSIIICLFMCKLLSIIGFILPLWQWKRQQRG